MTGVRVCKLLASLVVVLVCLEGIDARATSPRISFDHEVKDFGKVPYGDKLVERFPFSNVGDDPLIVQDVRAECGCTKTLTGSRELAPGGHSEIVATFDASGLGPGRKERHVYVRSNDPQRPSVKLTLLANVVRELTANPSTLTMTIKPSPQSLSVDLQIANTSDKPVMIISVKTLDRDVQAEMEKERLVVDPASTTPCHIVMSLGRDNRRPVIAGVLILETDHVREKALRVPYLIQLATPSSGGS
jgi:hypothetical protein